MPEVLRPAMVLSSNEWRWRWRGVGFVAAIIEHQAVALTEFYLDGVSFRPRFAVDGPLVHPAAAGEFLFDDQRDFFRGFIVTRLAENGVIPAIFGGRNPLCH